MTAHSQPMELVKRIGPSAAKTKPGPAAKKTGPGSRPGAGRRAIAIEFIEDEARRNVTASKRRKGLTKKCREFHILTGSPTLLVTSSTKGKIQAFASPGAMSLLLNDNLVQAKLVEFLEKELLEKQQQQQSKKKGVAVPAQVIVEEAEIKTAAEPATIKRPRGRPKKEKPIQDPMEVETTDGSTVSRKAAPAKPSKATTASTNDRKKQPVAQSLPLPSVTAIVTESSDDEQDQEQSEQEEEVEVASDEAEYQWCDSSEYAE